MAAKAEAVKQIQDALKENEWRGAGRGGSYSSMLPTILRIGPGLVKLNNEVKKHEFTKLFKPKASYSTLLRWIKVFKSKHLQEKAQAGTLTSKYVDHYPLGWVKSHAKAKKGIPTLKKYLMAVPAGVDLAQPIQQAAPVAPVGGQGVAAAVWDAEAGTFKLPHGYKIVAFKEKGAHGLRNDALIRKLKDKAALVKASMREDVPGWATLAQGQTAEIYVLFDGDNVKGFAFQNTVPIPDIKGSSVPHIHAYAVDSDLRGKKFGAALVNTVLRKLGSQAFCVADVEKTNEASLGCLEYVAGLRKLKCEALGTIVMTQNKKGEAYGELVWGKKGATIKHFKKGDTIEWCLGPKGQSLHVGKAAAKPAKRKSGAGQQQQQQQPQPQQQPQQQKKAKAAATTAKTKKKAAPARKPAKAKHSKAKAAAAAKKGKGQTTGTVVKGKRGKVLKGRVAQQVLAKQAKVAAGIQMESKKQKKK